MRPLLLIFLPALVVAAWLGLPAKPQPLAEEETFSSRIEVIARTCAACHGTDGQLATAIPPLAGKPEVVLNALLQAYKNDQIPQATVMPRIAKGFSDEELAALALYFSQINPEGSHE